MGFSREYEIFSILYVTIFITIKLKKYICINNE